MRGVLAAFIFLAVAGFSFPAVSASPGWTVNEKLVARIDSVAATGHGQALVIQAKGAVPGGGWKMPHLKLVKSPADPHAVVVEFLATPPPMGSAVIDGLLPVSANLNVKLPKGAVSVRVVSGSNEITCQILAQ